jgi:hypothetical protein
MAGCARRANGTGRSAPREARGRDLDRRCAAPYEIGRICFVQDPDGYRIELIHRDFPTPQDPDD